MADKQQVNNQKELNKTKQEQLAIEREIAAAQKRAKEDTLDQVSLTTGIIDDLKELVGIRAKTTTFDSNLLKVNREITTQITNQKSGLTSIAEVTKQQAKNEAAIEKAKKVQASLVASLDPQEKKQLGNAKATLTNIGKLQDEREELLSLGDKANAQDLSRIRSIEKEIKKRDETLRTQVKGLDTIQQQAFFTEKNIKAIERENAARDAEEQKLNDINDSLGLSGALLKGLGSIPGVGEGAKKAFETVEASIKKSAEDGKELPSRLKTAGMFATELGKELTKALTDPLVILTALGKILVSNNAKITEFERTLSLSEGEATLLAGELAVVSATTDNINVSTKTLVKTFMALNEELGIASTNFTDDVLVTSTILIENVGLAAKETANLAAAAQITGGNFEDQYKNALLATRTLQEQTGVQFNNKKILEEVGQVSGQIRANLGGNIEEIAKAVTQAKLFGASLEEVADAGKALLDFEQSITSEMEAELLLGKDLNLERARAAALDGDLITLGKELAEQAGSLSEFQEMNVLQQEALASAMGMTSDQLADILFQQEVQGKTAQQLRALGKDELANRLEQQNAQETLNALVANFQSLLADLAKPLDFILQAFSGIAKTMASMKELLLALTGIQLLYIGYSKIQAALETKKLLLTRKNFFAEVASMAAAGAKSVAQIPFVGPVLAVAALAALYAAGSALLGKGDDVLSPGRNSSGYGDRMLFGPEGAISLNNKDTVIAGTKLFQGDDVVSAGAGQVNIPVAPANKEGEKTNMLLTQLITQNAKKPQISPVGLYEVQ